MKNPRKQTSPRLPRDADVRPVAGHPAYLVSADGKFWTTLVDGEPAEKTLSQRKSNRRTDRGGVGRLRLRVFEGGRARMLDAASLACETWHGQRPPGAVVGFGDDDFQNLSRDNLAWRLPDVQVSSRDFVTAWQQSFSVGEVAEKLGGVHVGTVYTRAQQLREKGVRLKAIARGSVSADELNDLIDELG